jgi:predicted RecA/RadA family phage recombinase
MSWHNRDITKAYNASGVIAAYTVVKFGANDTTVSPAAAVSDLLFGVANELGISAADATAGATIDVIIDGVAEALAGAAITRGSRLTVDANGRVVAAAPAAGTNNQIIGIALKSAGAANDVIPILIAPGTVQG